MVSAQGRGIETLQTALENGPVAPSMVDVPFQSEPFPVYAVEKETLKDPLLRRARRADRFSKMATLAAYDAVKDARVELTPERTGIVLGTAFGPHPTVFNFLDDILEFGDAGVSPTLFSHSVHNAAASYISIALGLAGPSTTLIALTNPLQQSLLLAQSWLDQGVCDSVLVGGVEECGTVMEYIVSRKLEIAADKMRPFFDPAGPAVIPGEGAVFFLLGREASGPYAVEFGSIGEKPESDPDLWVVDFESSRLPSSAPAGCWSYLAGSTPFSTAVSCAAAALMLNNGAVYPQTGLLKTKTLHPEQIGCTGRNETALYLRKWS